MQKSGMLEKQEEKKRRVSAREKRKTRKKNSRFARAG